MTAHYESLPNATLYSDAFAVSAPETAVVHELWPRKTGVFIRNVPISGDAPVDVDAPAPWQLELGYGQFGLVPPWVKSASDAKLRSTKLVNARAETVTTSNNFRDTWLAGQRCIVPMMAFFEDDWRSGKAVPTRITRVDGKPMGVAGLWQRWAKDGTEIVSFTLLTINANSHALLHRYQQNGNEKRMPVILGEGAYGAWLSARPEKAREFMRTYPTHLLTANPVEKRSQLRPDRSGTAHPS